MPFISNGTTILDNGAFSVSLGSKILIKEITASADATISFVDGTADVVLDSTYPIYKFEFINMHPATNDTAFTFQSNASGGSGYNETMTTTRFKAGQNEAGDYTVLGYETGSDQAQGTSFQVLTQNVGNVSDESLSGQITIYNPSSTVFVKHFIATFNTYQHGNGTYNDFTAGYFNTTSALNDFQFKMVSGNIDSGKIKLYGIKDS
jgi:hypothetical protein